ncbi:hypothetical protein ACFQO4_03145 [Saliphagus sp. GCM10025334]
MKTRENVQGVRAIDLLTYWYAWFGFGKIHEISEHTYNGKTRQVYWFDSEDSKGGHCTPFATILMNRQRLEEYSEQVTDYVFVHETGHADLPWYLQFLVYLTLIPSVLIALVMPFAAGTQILVVLFGTGSAYYTVLAVVSGLLAIGLFTLPFLVFSWISEGHAELVALKELGETAFLECHAEIEEKSERGLLRRLIHRVQYPPPELVVWGAQKFKHT